LPLPHLADWWFALQRNDQYTLLPSDRRFSSSVPTPEAMVYNGSPESYLPVQAELPEGYVLLEPNSGSFSYLENPGYVVVFYNPDKAFTGSTYIIKYKLVVFDSKIAAETYFTELVISPVTEFVSNDGFEMAVREFTMLPEFDQIVYEFGSIPAEEGGDSLPQPVHVLIFRSENLTGYVMVTGVEVETEGTKDILSEELQFFVSLVLEKIQ
jgi:hypothetical protein